MREIKFRVWNPETKKIHNMPFLEVCRSAKSGGWYYSPHTGGDFPRVVLDKYLMQYTGLKDKNGMKIYEGDIVKAYHYQREEVEMHCVRYEAPCFTLGLYWKDGSHDWYSMEQYDSFELEVIGNIYENPELLAGHTT